jgi:hypothetical protein
MSAAPMPSFFPVPIPWDLVLRQLLLAPCFEEILFRLGLQERLSTSHAAAARRHAVALTALAFGATHAIVLAIVSPAPPSLPALLLALATALPAWWIGRSYRRHRSLPRCIAWHAGFNACWLLVAPALLPLLASALASPLAARLTAPLTAPIASAFSASLSSS